MYTAQGYAVTDHEPRSSELIRLTFAVGRLATLTSPILVSMRVSIACSDPGGAAAAGSQETQSFRHELFSGPARQITQHLFKSGARISRDISRPSDQHRSILRPKKPKSHSSDEISRDLIARSRSTTIIPMSKFPGMREPL